MRIEEKKDVTVKKSVTVGYKCDSCGKVVHEGGLPSNWHSFDTNHDDWGNDSIDSFSYYHVCSPKCYFNKMNELLTGYQSFAERTRSGEISGMRVQFALDVCSWIDKQ